MKIIVEGIDRIGKSGLIEGLINTYGYHHLVHFTKPVHTNYYKHYVGPNHQFEYQYASHVRGFRLLNDSHPVIFDRFHLGEAVYSKRYRGYSGDYVFLIEKEHPKALNETYLILLYSSNVNMLIDDGKSLDYAKRKEEQDDFINAFEKSSIKRKITIDVYDIYSQTYHPRDVILQKVVDEIKNQPLDATMFMNPRTFGIA